MGGATSIVMNEVMEKEMSSHRYVRTSKAAVAVLVCAGPICFNPPAARSVLPTTYKRTEMVLAGKTKAEIIEGNKAAFEKGELPALEPGSMSYMMSKNAYLTDDGDHDLAHLMIYAPPLDGKAWGADLPKSPVMLIQQFKGAQPIDVFIVPVGRWSDGTPAPVM